MKHNKNVFINFGITLILCTLFFFTSMSFAYTTQANEEISSYHSDIKVNNDSSMVVEETITVIALGQNIKRGIYRDFPTVYRDNLNNKYVVDFEVLEVLRDGEPENFRVESIKNGKRVYIGSSNIYLKRGEYTYTIKYYTNRQLGFFRQHDELYWNVTGNDWSFPINKASAKITLPNDISKDKISHEAYTGVKGSKGQSYTSFVDEDGSVYFETTKSLNNKEGLTIVVGWPKGYVVELTTSQKVQYFLKHNLEYGFSLLFIFIVLMYYYLIWRAKGKDPQKGSIIPFYEPPDGLSPASVRFIKRMGFDNKTLTASIINMAVKGYLTIKERSVSEYNKEYILIKNNYDIRIVLSPEEKVIANTLFRSCNEIRLSDKEYKKIQKAIKSSKQVLKKSYENSYFLNNKIYFGIGCAVSVSCLMLNALINSIVQRDIMAFIGAIFASVWLTFWSVGVVLITKFALEMWKKAINGKENKGGNIAIAIFLSFFSLPFILGEFLVLNQLGSMVGSSYALTLVVLLIINIIFYYLLKAYSKKGREVLDLIEGFKLYLSVAEEERLNYKYKIDKTPEVFEKFLPYALALDVEQQWAEQFANVFSNIINEEDGYHPSWYHGDISRDVGIVDFTSSLSNSFASSVSSSSSPPGSSSGGSGGGSSGGGGGGGGGGGW